MANISIHPATEYLRQFVDEIDKGIYAIPVFQRNFVWTESQVIALMDSIFRGYPIGSILLWKPQEDYTGISKDILTDERINSPKPEYYVLDGRQRLTAFYGCVSKLEDKRDIFKMYYNLDAQCFCYLQKNSKDFVVELSKIYDTFSLLGVMDSIRHNENIPDTLANDYISELKSLNTIFQQYMTGEIKLDNCSLEEAGTVFSRINSQGTDISNASMLQAIYYKKEGDPLIEDELCRIIDDLSIYSFDNLSDNDLLKCLYLYVGKNFYDDFKLDYFKNHDLKVAAKELRRDLFKAVEFLHDECLVLSGKLLPYMRQLEMLVAFFKVRPNPTEKDKHELRRWFFYTTYQQTFQNSSLTIVRNQFSRFKKFIDGTLQTATDYQDIDFDTYLDFRFSLRSAKADFMLLTMIHSYVNFIHLESYDYLGQSKLQGNNPAGIFVSLRGEDKSIVSMIRAGKPLSDEVRKAYLVSDPFLQAMEKHDIEGAVNIRCSCIVEAEMNLLKGLNLKIEGYDQ